MDAVALQQMIAEDREEWSKLVTALDAHPEGALHDPESPDWTARDVYTHIAAMMDGSGMLIAEHLAGKPHRRIYEGTSEDDGNARIRQQHIDMSLEDAQAWAQRAFDGRIAAIQSIPAGHWDSRFESYAHADGAQHYRAHRSYMTRE